MSPKRRQQTKLDTLLFISVRVSKNILDFGILLDTPHLFLTEYLKFGGASPTQNCGCAIGNRWGVSKNILKSNIFLDTPTEIGGEYPKILIFSVF